MKKTLFILPLAILGFIVFFSRKNLPLMPADVVSLSASEIDDSDGDVGPLERDSLEFEKTKDPALGYIPAERLYDALVQTEQRKKSQKLFGKQSLVWTERGPNFDSVGPSNGNTRPGDAYCSGYTRAILIDTLNDPSGNTVFLGSNGGGLWKCTNYLSSNPNWTRNDDFATSLSIGSICQDPSNANVMYYSTGDAPFSTVQLLGAGIWKSTNGGTTWNRLLSTVNYLRCFKIVCDASGNIYIAARPTTVPVNQPAGLLRSTDGGATWTDITPSGLTSSNNTCTDIEISSTGRLHASFGYQGTVVNHRYTDIPSTVTSGVGWNASTGIRSIASPPSAIRLELACRGNILYGITVNPNFQADSCYKSTDGGATWTKQNASVYSNGVLGGQGHYNITLQINPENSNEFILAGLDAWKSTNSGLTCNVHLTNWVTTPPYVHADHHFLQWWMLGAESRIVIGGDGGTFISRDGGTTWEDRNKNLVIKEFYSLSIHPDAGSPYILAGAQDNGTNQLPNPGLSYAYEIRGGDGMFNHINQQNPGIQYASIYYNQYSRSIDTGQSWSSIMGYTTGLFVNPFEIDDKQDVMYASNASNAIRRIFNVSTGGSVTSDILTIAGFGGFNNTAIKVSPYNLNRIYLGTNTGTLFRLNNANTVTNGTVAANLTNITGAGFPAAFLNCINIGSSDQYLVAVFTNFGINNVWYTTNGGTSWTAIDGDLPDVPVRWAVFDPQHDDKLFIATSTGIYYTDHVNGGSTAWLPETGFPNVRTDMLKVRLSDNTLAAATYGRGVWTAVIPSTPEIRFNAATITSAIETSITASACRNYKEYTLNVSTVSPPTGDATVTYTVSAGNTATQGADFDFTTNGNFSSPSNQHTFNSGVAQTKSVTVRIYDDTQVEPLETFVLQFAVTGATNAFGGNFSTYTFRISDNDVSPVAISSTLYTVGTNTSNFGTSAASPMFDAKLQRKKSAVLYKSNELVAGGVLPGMITSIGFNINKNSTRAYQNLQIKAAQLNFTYLVDGGFFYSFAGTLVKSLASYNTVNGWNTFTLDTPFAWDGTSSILIELCYDNLTADATDLADVSVGNSDPQATTNQGNFYHQSNISCSSGFSSVTYFFNGAKPQIRLTSSNNGVTIENALNASRTEYLGPNTDAYFYSNSGVLMARVRNLTSFDYGCTQVVIDRAGAGSSPFWNNNTANFLTNKSFRILPTNNNALGQYEVTLYYTAAEKAGWETATGQSWNNIELIKVSNAISDVTPGNPGGGGSVQSVVPSRSTLGNDYSLTHTFSTGFSGFGAGIAGVALPVGLLDFTGRLRNNSAYLSWKTTFELNSKGFNVERSYDGLNFTKIGYVEAAGFSNIQVSYNFNDKMIAQDNNYYRLKQIDLDNRFEYSRIILIKNPQADKNAFKILRNPFANNIDFQFAKVPIGKVQVSMVDLKGLQVMNWSNNVSYTRVRIDVGALRLSRGIYILTVQADGRKYVERIMKE